MARELRMMRIQMSVFLAMCITAASATANPEFFDEGPMAGKGYPFSESVRVGKILFISGQVGVDDNNELVEGGIVGETHQTMSNIGGALERRGLSFSDVVKCTVFLADVAEWGEFNTIYTSYFEPPYPARSALGANGLALGARLEVECIAAYPSE
jgi:reactive intermediate/imine deaminase